MQDIKNSTRMDICSNKSTDLTGKKIQLTEKK